ncbi:tachykinin-4 isoform X1 [Phascolarctos cinereus]|uniref:Tachykinin-4-like isoform X4 n=1 Tax=Phascolarctos cinereus TaxID=38626 RepID=A0A6P5L511_PHACI|nr:tachykinin-4-like isoform X4 [Phascolarctos cinereus]
MPSCLALLLLMCLSLKMVGSQTEEPRSEDEPWLILSLKEGELPRISLQPLVQEVKRRKTGQFYPLMGKRARGKSLIQSVENKGHQEDMFIGLMGRSTNQALYVDWEDKGQGSEWKP